MNIKSILGNIRRKNFHKRNKLFFDYTGQDAENQIYEHILSGKPMMICRFGSGELESLCRFMTYADHKSKLSKFWDYFSGRNSVFLPDIHDYDGLQNNAGVFNIDPKGLEDFKDAYLSSIPLIDILGSWREDENNPYIKPFYNKDMIRIPLQCLEPYYFDNPWSRILEDKKVLVIHPFAQSIESQYKHHDKLFTNPNILPNFELKTIKAIQSIAGQPTPFPTWLAALNNMKEQITAAEFDIALIGCGAYGLPLAAHCKSIGKQAVHMGGALQILFGIKGKRWDETPKISALYNDYWTRPSESEKPRAASSVEGACYW